MKPYPFDLAEGLAGYCQPAGSERVLWLHGYTMDSTLWFDLWSRLPDWSHFGLDLPGHGRSAPLNPGQSLSELGRQLADVALAHDIQHLVALSFGAIIGLQMLLEAPGQFRTVTLAAANFTGGPEDPQTPLHYRRLARHYWHKGVGPELAQLWMSAPPDIFTGAARDQALFQAITTVVERHSWQEMRSMAYMKLTRDQQSAQLPALGHCTARGLILVGSDDMPAFKDAAPQIAAHWPGAQVRCVEDAGHLPLLERPDQAAWLLNAHWRDRLPAPISEAAP